MNASARSAREEATGRDEDPSLGLLGDEPSHDLDLGRGRKHALFVTVRSEEAPRTSPSALTTNQGRRIDRGPKHFFLRDCAVFD